MPNWAYLLPLAGVVMAGLSRTRGRRRFAALTVLAPVLFLAVLAACGGLAGSGEQPPPPPSITVTIGPSNPDVILGGSQDFTATVKNASSDVKWQVEGVEGGIAATGTIVSTGMDKATYTAPDSLTTPASFTITAVLVLDSTKTGTTRVDIPSVGVVVSPSAASLYANETGNAWPANVTQQQFGATVSNASNQSVTWAVVGGSANGTIDTNGVYSAPASVPNPANVTITAVPEADPNKSGSGAVSILTPTRLGTFPNITVSATEGVVTHSQTVTLTVR